MTFRTKKVRWAQFFSLLTGLASGLIGGLAWFCWPDDDLPVWQKVGGAVLVLTGFLLAVWLGWRYVWS